MSGPNEPSWLSNLLQQGLLLIIAAICLFVSVFDFFGWIDQASLVAKKTTEVMLLLMSLIAIYLVLERRRLIEGTSKEISTKLDALASVLERDVEIIIDSVDGVEFRRFDSSTDQMGYIAERVAAAKSSIDDLTWSHRVSLHQHLPARKLAEEKYEAAIANASKKIQYREIFVFNNRSRIEKLKKRLGEGAAGYSCAYYPDHPTPRLQFMVVDEEEVIFASSVLPVRCAIRHKELARVFSTFYGELWDKAILLKAGNDLNTEEIEKIVGSNGMRIEDGSGEAKLITGPKTEAELAQVIGPTEPATEKRGHGPKRRR